MAEPGDEVPYGEDLANKRTQLRKKTTRIVNEIVEVIKRRGSRTLIRQLRKDITLNIGKCNDINEEICDSCVEDKEAEKQWKLQIEYKVKAATAIQHIDQYLEERKDDAASIAYNPENKNKRMEIEELPAGAAAQEDILEAVVMNEKMTLPKPEWKNLNKKETPMSSWRDLDLEENMLEQFEAWTREPVLKETSEQFIAKYLWKLTTGVP